MTVLLLLLGGLFGGGGNDLLDYVSTTSYWKWHDVPVTADAMAAELAPVADADVTRWVRQLAADDADLRARAGERLRAAGPAALARLDEAARGADAATAAQAVTFAAEVRAAPKAADVRRLMAIRAAGELRARAALPALQPLTTSADPFVAGYARAAVAAIEGKPPAARDRAAWLDRDVWLLPAGVRAVVRYVPSPGASGAMTFDDVARQLKDAPGGADREAVVDAVARRALDVAEQVGNIRFDGLTVGASGDLALGDGPAAGGEPGGFVVAIARGRYDRVAVAGLFAGLRVPATAVDGVTVYRPTAETAVFFPSDDRAVLVASPRGKALPLAEAVAAVAKGAGGVRGDAEMVRLVQSVDAGLPLSVVAKMSDVQKRLPGLAGVDTLALTARPGAAADTLDVRLRATAADATAAKAVAAGWAATAADLRRGFGGGAAADPVTRLAAGLLDRLRVSADGAAADAATSVRLTRPELAALLFRGAAGAAGVAGDNDAAAR